MNFEKVTPESVGIHSRDIRTYLEEVYKAGVQLHSFMLIRHGKSAAQGWVRPYNKDALHILYSFSKTITATAIGFARQEKILSLDEKLVDLFPDELPEVVSENLALADIESLLTMSCGHETEITQDDILAHEGNWVKAFLAHEFVFRPHTMFQYNTYGTDLLSAILEKKTGLSLTAFLTPRLFSPLGIPGRFHPGILDCGERDGSVAASGKDVSDKRPVYCSRMGDRVVEPGSPYSDIEGGGWGFHMRTEEMAKIMWFLEQRGVWDGKRLLSEEWFDRAFTKQIETMNGVYDAARPHWQQGYCYQCWCNPLVGTWRADGAYGQFGYVLSDKDAVMVMTAASVDTESQLQLFASLVAERMTDEPLPESKEEQEALERMIGSMKIPGLWAIRQPWSEQKLGTRSCHIHNPGRVSLEEFIAGEGHFGHDALKLESISFTFDHNQLLLGITQETGEHTSEKMTETLRIGLDGEYRASRLSDGIYYSSGKWVWSDEMEFEIRFEEALGAAIVRLTYDRSGVKLSVRSQIPEENDLTKRRIQELTGSF